MESQIGSKFNLFRLVIPEYLYHRDFEIKAFEPGKFKFLPDIHCIACKSSPKFEQIL